MNNFEQTLSIIKPDAVERSLENEIKEIFKNNGFSIIKEKKIQIEKSEAEKFYKVHETKPFYNDLCTYLSSGPILVMVLEKQNAILKTLGLDRKVMQINTFMEYLSIGLIAGILGGALALLATFLIEREVFEISPKIYWEVLLIGASSSILVIGFIAALFTFYISSKTPKDVLQGADA